jgi:Bacterial Ig domain
VVDTTRNILWVWGGGHNDYSGNEIYAFNLNTLKMTRANNPANPTPTCSDAFSNGTPSSRHTYGGTVYIPTADVMFVFGGVPYCPSGGFISDSWALALSQVGSSGTGGWTQLNPKIVGNGGNGPSNQFGNSQMQYDPNTGLVILNESTYGLWSYNYSTNTYTSLNTGVSDIGLHQGTVIDPVHKLFLRFGDGSGQAINIAPGSGYTETQLKMTGCSGLSGGSLAGNNPGLQWDPVLQVVVGWPNFGPGVYLYNPATDSCTTQTYSASAPPDSGMTGSPSTTNGTFKRFGYFPAAGVYVLVNEWTTDVHTLRLTAAGSSGGGGTGSTPDSISNVATNSITTNSAMVDWNTSAAASTQVMYGTTPSLGSSTTKNNSMATSHTQPLSGLTANMLYYYTVQSVDGSGNTVSSSGYTFGTANSSGPVTPPTISISSPASGASLSGTVTATASATAGSNPIASVQFSLDGAALGSADTASPYSLSWNTAGASNGTHTLSATATDSAGNTAAAAGVSVTVSNSTSNAEADFQARCAAAGVIRCVTFDTTSTISGNAAPGLPLIASGLTTPSIDTATFASGGGSLHFAVPAGATSANTSGSFNIDFSDDFSQQIDSLINGDPASLTTACGGSPCKNEVWIQWRQRFDSGMLQKFANSNGWKQVIVGEGDTASFLSYSCSDLETVVENSSQFEIPSMYHSCGVKLDEYDPLEVNTGRTDNQGNGIFSPENAAGGYLNCTFTVTVNVPTIPPCVPYVANQWMTFQLHIAVGSWYPGGVSSSGGAPAAFKHDSTIQLWVAQEGQPSQIVMDFHPGATSAACDAQQQDIPSCQTGYDLVNPTAYGHPDGNGNSIREKFGKIWLLPYQTDLNCPSCAAANTWYDELIISYQQVADPKF